jgi:hypothetical protein
MISGYFLWNSRIRLVDFSVRIKGGMERSEESIMLEREYRSVLTEVLRPEDNRFEDVSLRQFCHLTENEIKKLVFNHSKVNNKFSRTKYLASMEKAEFIMV